MGFFCFSICIPPKRGGSFWSLMAFLPSFRENAGSNPGESQDIGISPKKYTNFADAAARTAVDAVSPVLGMV